MTSPNPLASHLAALTEHPFIPELHVDDCTDDTCAACRLLLSTTLYAVDTWIDRAHVFVKQYWEQVAGELVVTGLRIGQYPEHVVGRFGDIVVRHYDGRHTVRAGTAPVEELTAAVWNELYPVGTKVVAYPGARPEVGGSECKRLETTTRHKAWTLHGQTPVVMVHGHGAYIQLTHVDPVGTTDGAVA